jgi:hypothetical protein
VAAGLHSAHERRDSQGKPREIVHRDVSPSNVLVTYDGTVKVVDFGIAKAASESSRETHTGNLKGKLSYMSPEQCLQAEAIDRRSDVFALGILLWELTTGKRLFHEDNDYATIKKIVETDATSPRWVRPGYPHELERVVMKALRRDRDERYLSALDLQTELERFAIEYKVATSSVALARTMRDLFGEREEPWHRVPEAILGTELTEPAVLPVGPAAEIVQAADAAEAAFVRAGRVRRWVAAGALGLSVLAVTAALVGRDERRRPAMPSAPAATPAPAAAPEPAPAAAPVAAEPAPVAAEAAPVAAEAAPPVQAPALVVEKAPAGPTPAVKKRPPATKKTARPIDEPFLPK